MIFQNMHEFIFIFVSLYMIFISRVFAQIGKSGITEEINGSDSFKIIENGLNQSQRSPDINKHRIFFVELALGWNHFFSFITSAISLMIGAILLLVPHPKIFRYQRLLTILILLIIIGVVIQGFRLGPLKISIKKTRKLSVKYSNLLDGWLILANILLGIIICLKIISNYKMVPGIT